MRKIKLVFTRSKKFNLVSLLFRLIERASFSHTAIYIETKDLINLYAHVNHQNVHINTQTYFEKKYESVKSLEFQINDVDYDYMIKEISRYEGASYGYLTVLGIGISRFLKLLGFRVNNSFKDKNNSFFCSEFSWYILTIVGIDIDSFDPELDGPKKLYQILSGDYTEGQR